MNYEINYEEKKINELIKKYKTATPGTWGVREWDNGKIEVVSYNENEKHLCNSNEEHICDVLRREDAFFIAESMNTIPLLMNKIHNLEVLCMEIINSKN